MEMTNKKATSAILFSLMLLITPSATAQVLPFFTDTALTVGFESNAFRTFSRFVVRNQLRIEGEEVPDPSNQDVFVFAEVFAVPVRIDSECDNERADIYISPLPS